MITIILRKCSKDILNKYGFVTDGQLNFQYYDLINDSDKINLDDFPVEVKSIRFASYTAFELPDETETVK